MPTLLLVPAIALGGAGLLAAKSFGVSDAAERTDAKAGAKHKKDAEAAEASTAPATPAPQADNPLVTQAKEAGVKSCLNQIRKESSAIQTDYAVFSSWAQAAPDAHLFQSMLSMDQRDPQIGRSFGLLLAAPTAQGCDSSSLQVAPMAKSCNELQAEWTKSGQPLQGFNGLWTTQTNGPLRQIMVPAGSSTCVVVSISMNYDVSK